jgi:hypothetical protein
MTGLLHQQQSQPSRRKIAICNSFLSGVRLFTLPQPEFRFIKLPLLRGSGSLVRKEHSPIVYW